MRLKVSPTLMGHMLEVADACQHGKYRLDQHTIIPFAPLAKPEVSGMPVNFLPSHVGKNDHIVSQLLNDRLKSRAIVDIGGVTVPSYNQTEMIQHKTKFAANNPTPIGFTLFPNLLVTTSFSTRVQQFNTIAIDDTDKRWLGHKIGNHLPVAIEQAKQTRPIRQIRKEHSIITVQPTPKCAL